MKAKFNVGEKLKLDVSTHAFWRARNTSDLPATVVEYLGKRHGQPEYVVSTPNPFHEGRLNEEVVEEYRLRRT